MVSGKNEYDIYSLNQVTFRWDTYEPHRDKTNKMACAPSEDSAWASAQSDQSLHCALNGYLRTQAFFTGRTCQFVGFVMRRLICLESLIGWAMY